MKVSHNFYVGLTIALTLIIVFFWLPIGLGLWLRWKDM